MWLAWQWAVVLTLAFAGVAAVGAATGARQVHAVFREAAVLSLLYTLWRIVGRISVIHPEGAYERAEWLWDLERTLGMPNERVWQEMILGDDTVVQAANIYYAGAHVPLMGVFLVWLFFRHRGRYAPWRTTLAVSTIACVFIQLLPLAPPRLMPQFGILDTPHMYGQSVYLEAGASLSGQLQAMPSIHVGWAALIAWATLVEERNWTRWLGPLHAVATMWVVVVTGNHYWLDGVVAIAVLWLCRVALLELRRRTGHEQPGWPVRATGGADTTPSSAVVDEPGVTATG